MRDSTKKKPIEITITNLPDGPSPQTVIVAGQPCNLLETLLKNRIEIDHSCGGQGSCGTCRILIDRGQQNINSHTELETEISQDRKFEANERLSCQCEIAGSISIQIPEGKI